MSCAYRTVALFALLPALSSFTRASVLVVDASGSGTYSDLPAAVAAAADGDVLLVRGGTYSGFTVVNRALDVVADAGASVRIDGVVRIEHLGLTRTFTLTGVEIVAPPHVAALLLVSNSGSVRVQGCTLRGGVGSACSNSADGGNALHCLHSDDVAVARSTLVGGDSAEDLVTSGRGGRGLYANDSRVALHAVEARGGRASDFSAGCPGAPGYGYGGHGGEGVVVEFGLALFASGCELRGGDGSDFVPPALVVSQGCGASGLVANSTSSSALRALATTFLPGASGIGGSNCGVIPPFRTPGATLQLFPGSARRLNASRVTREGQLVRMEIEGLPGDQVEITFADRGRFGPSDPLRGVHLVARRTPHPTLLAGTIGASGRLVVAWAVGELGAGIAARRLFAQATCIDSTGIPTLTNAATIVLLDAAY